MPPDQARRARLPLTWILAALAVAALVALALILPDPERPGGSEGSEAPTTPTALPLESTESTTLTVPQDVRIAERSIDLVGGSSYLVTVEVTTEKPEGSAGEAMYMGIGLQCASHDPQADGRSVGGTQNLLDGEQTTFRNQLLLTPEVDARYSCNITASNPYEEVAAAGVTVEINGTWIIDRATGLALETEVDEMLPATVPTGEVQVVLKQTIPLAELTERSDRRLRVLSSLHVTTCTGVNGSREAGRAWCAEEDIDETGSDVIDTLRLEVLDSRGAVCAVIAESRGSAQIDRHRHHQLFAADETADLRDEPCGETLRISRVIENRGPASLVVHSSNTSMITLEVTDG